jgi:hypothetical protein
MVVAEPRRSLAFGVQASKTVAEKKRQFARKIILRHAKYPFQ